MSDQAERWRNVAQAAQWLAEGREVEVRRHDGGWMRLIPDEYGHVSFASWEQYRLKPEPPKPREWTLELRPGHPTLLCATHGPCNVRPGEVIRVREVIEP